MLTHMGFYADKLPTAVTEQLRAERAAKQMPFKELVQRTGMSEQTLIRYFNGKRDIPLTQLAAIADALGLTPIDIINRAMQRIKH